MIWTMLHPSITPEHLGLIPSMLSEVDPRPAKEQFDSNYQHGGGWRSFPGFKLGTGISLHYPGDEPLEPLAMCEFRDELIVVYQFAWVAIIQRDQSFEVCRMD